MTNKELIQKLPGIKIKHDIQGYVRIPLTDKILSVMLKTEEKNNKFKINNDFYLEKKANEYVLFYKDDKNVIELMDIRLWDTLAGFFNFKTEEIKFTFHAGWTPSYTLYETLISQALNIPKNKLEIRKKTISAQMQTHYLFLFIMLMIKSKLIILLKILFIKQLFIGVYLLN